MSKVKTLPAPVRGWIENENLAANRGLGATVFENWFPLQSTVRVRGGFLLGATIGAPVVALMPYKAGGIEKLFAASATAIYDISALDNDTVPTASVTGLTSGRWSYTQMTAPGGASYLLAVNGADSARYFNGTAWATITAVSTPISVTGVDTADLSHIWVHNERVWAVEGGSLSAWYLPVSSFGGAATEFSMAGVFKDGGSLLFGATWSGDSGSGMADRNVFVTDQGEVAVYEGIDPSDAATWAKVGTYNVGRPVGTGVVKAGGDLLISTTDGIVPLSQIVVKDPAAMAVSAVTANIEPAWRRVIRANPSHVQMLKWQRESMMIVGYPESDETHVCNMQTGAWAKWTGHDVQCMALYNDLAYFGAADGNIYQFEGSGSDDGAIYVARAALLPDHLDAPGAHKEILQARATFRFLAPFTPKLSVATNYGRNFPTAPSAAVDTSSPALWDVGIWDVSEWDDAPDSEERLTEVTRWKSIGVSGISASAQVQIACGASRLPDAELVTIDLLYEPGGTVV